MDLKNRVPGFFLKEEGLKHKRIPKVAFLEEKMQISFILVPLAALLLKVMMPTQYI